MSTVFLLKDRPPNKRGDTISVPFVMGRQMVRDGEACYPTDAPKASPPQAQPVRKVTRQEAQATRPTPPVKAEPAAPATDKPKPTVVDLNPRTV